MLLVIKVRTLERSPSCLFVWGFLFSTWAQWIQQSQPSFRFRINNIQIQCEQSSSYISSPSISSAALYTAMIWKHRPEINYWTQKTPCKIFLSLTPGLLAHAPYQITFLQFDVTSSRFNHTAVLGLLCRQDMHLTSAAHLITASTCFRLLYFGIIFRSVATILLLFTRSQHTSPAWASSHSWLQQCGFPDQSEKRTPNGSHSLG